MDIEVELYKISERIKDIYKRIEEQRIDLDCTSDYFKNYIYEVCIPTLNNNIDYLENSLLHLERKRSEDDEEYYKNN